MKKELPTYEAVSAKLRHEDGVLFWRVDANSNARAGCRAGSLSPSGYATVWLGGVNFRSHRIVWLLAHGEWPESDIDHINMNRADNRPSNLRLCTRSQNGGNRMPNKVRKYGLMAKGVRLDKQSGKFQARIMCNGKASHLGYFASESEAANAYNTAAEVNFGEFARPNALGLVI